MNSDNKNKILVEKAIEIGENEYPALHLWKRINDLKLKFALDILPKLKKYESDNPWMARLFRKNSALNPWFVDTRGWSDSKRMEFAEYCSLRGSRVYAYIYTPKSKGMLFMPGKDWVPYLRFYSDFHQLLHTTFYVFEFAGLLGDRHSDWDALAKLENECKEKCYEITKLNKVDEPPCSIM